ncbi:hypothetical protein ACRRTK_016201 [Alexandromys fortis]
MGNSCYSMVVTVLLVVGTERTRALQDSCAKCEAGKYQTDRLAYATMASAHQGNIVKCCSLGGKSVLENGTTEKDVICGPTLVSFSPEGGRSLRILTWLLALTSALLLFLLCITLGPIVAKWSSKKFPYLFKQRRPPSHKNWALHFIWEEMEMERDPECREDNGHIGHNPGLLALEETSKPPEPEPYFLLERQQGFCEDVFKALKMAVRTAQEEDACSCRFPEEEEGGGGGYEL